MKLARTIIYFVLTLNAAVLLFGCTTSKSQRSTEFDSAQTGGRTVILVPIVILSPTDKSPAGNNMRPPRGKAPPGQSTGGPDAAPANPPLNL